MNCCSFQYILNAATSPATRMSEETLTYLNQGILSCNSLLMLCSFCSHLMTLCLVDATHGTMHHNLTLTNCCSCCC